MPAAIRLDIPITGLRDTAETPEQSKKRVLEIAKQIQDATIVILKKETTSPVDIAEGTQTKDEHIKCTLTPDVVDGTNILSQAATYDDGACSLVIKLNLN